MRLWPAGLSFDDAKLSGVSDFAVLAQFLESGMSVVATRAGCQWALFYPVGGAKLEPHAWILD